jgi:hypothetical protein
MIEVEDIKKMKLGKDDILILQLPEDDYYGIQPSYKRRVTREFFKQLRKTFNINFLVIPSTVKLKILNKKDLLKEIDVKSLEKSEFFNPDDLNT